MNKRTILFLSILIIFTTSVCMASHYRAGEISYSKIIATTYEITVTTYTDPTHKDLIDPKTIILSFGDGLTTTLDRNNGPGNGGILVNANPSNLVNKNTYSTTHTYGGYFSYTISISDPNRIANINNLNNGFGTDQIPFYVQSLLIIEPDIFLNHSPVLRAPPIDEACMGKTFTHNPAAFDPDGDSLAFVIVPPQSAPNINTSFTIPQFSDSFSLNAHNGQLTWTTPVTPGFYNFAIRIFEYRFHKLIGYVTRDMQVYVHDNCFNHPPVFEVFRDTCIVANQLLKYTILAHDSDLDQTLVIQKFGGPFEQVQSPATLTPDPATGLASGDSAIFRWQPSCNAIRFRPHQPVFKVTDNAKTVLSAYLTYNIKVVGPAPTHVTLVIEKNGLRINWAKDSCNLAYGYRIFRKIDSGYWHHGPCETGVPSSTGYVLSDTTKGTNNNSYFDNNHGAGLSPLVRYCYMITNYYAARSDDGTAYYGDFVDGYASEEVCDLLLRTKPVITNVSVEVTSAVSGKINVRWLRPDVLDSIQYKPPYKVQLQRAVGTNSNYINTGSVYNYAAYNDLNDEQYTDSSLNTSAQQYFYKVVLSGTNLAEESIAASSVKLSIIPADRALQLKWNYNVPWYNT